MVKKLLGLAVFATVLGAVLSAAPACAGSLAIRDKGRTGPAFYCRFWPAGVPGSQARFRSL